MSWGAVVGKVVYYITFPIIKLVLLVINVLLYLLQWLASPFVYIIHTFWRLCLIPYNIAAKFEAMWYFIACAILIGLVLALVLHGIFRTFVLIFRLDRKPQPIIKDSPAKGPDVKTYRKSRAKKRQQEEEEQQVLEARARALANSPLLKDALKQMQRTTLEDAYLSPGAKRAGRGDSLLDQTIIERSSEEDS